MFRNLLSVFLLFIFRLALGLFIISFAFTAVFASPDTIKSSLKSSGIYDRFVDNVIDTTLQEGEIQEKSSLPLNDAGVRSAAKTAFDPKTLQTSIETAIDGIYGWLEGKTPLPSFVIDLSGPKQNFANNIGNVIEQRLLSLPPCTSPDQIPTEIDPFKLTCLPPNIDLASEKQRLSEELANSQDFLASPVLSNEDLPKENNQNVFERYSFVPVIFQLLKRGPLVFGTLAFFAGLGAFLLDKERRRGVKRIGMAMVSVGATVGVTTLLFSYLFGRANQFDPNTINIQSAIISILSSVYAKANLSIVIVSSIVASIGLAIWLAGKFLKSETKAHKPDDGSAPTVTMTDEPPVSIVAETTQTNDEQTPKSPPVVPSI